MYFWYVTFHWLTSGFTQLAAAGCRQNILDFHCLQGKSYLYIRMGITVFKIIISGGISLDISRKLRFMASQTCCRTSKFPTIHPAVYFHKWKFWIQIYPEYNIKKGNQFSKRDDFQTAKTSKTKPKRPKIIKLNWARNFNCSQN